MVFIFGGKNQGKLRYARQMFGEGLTVSDLKDMSLTDALSADIILNVQESVRAMLRSQKDPVGCFTRLMEKLKGKILIGTEIGCGIVPADPEEREWRDQTGWVYQILSQNADRVDRVWAGIGQILKK